MRQLQIKHLKPFVLAIITLLCLLDSQNKTKSINIGLMKLRNQHDLIVFYLLLLDFGS